MSNNVGFSRRRVVILGIVILIAAAHILRIGNYLQGELFGIPVLGSTFDPLDYLMYTIGALSAAILDTQVYSRIFDFWELEKV